MGLTMARPIMYFWSEEASAGPNSIDYGLMNEIEDEIKVCLIDSEGFWTLTGKFIFWNNFSILLTLKKMLIIDAVTAAVLFMAAVVIVPGSSLRILFVWLLNGIVPVATFGE